MTSVKITDWDKPILTESVEKKHTANSLLELLNDINEGFVTEILIEYLCQHDLAFDRVKEWFEDA